MTGQEPDRSQNLRLERTGAARHYDSIGEKRHHRVTSAEVPHGRLGLSQKFKKDPMIDTILTDEYYDQVAGQGSSGRHHYTTSRTGGVLGNPGYKTELPDADNSCYQCSQNPIEDGVYPGASLNHSQHIHRSPSAPRGVAPAYLHAQLHRAAQGSSFRGQQVPGRVGFQQSGALTTGSLTGGAHGRSMNAGIKSAAGIQGPLLGKSLDRSSSAHQRGLVGHQDTALLGNDSTLKSSMKYSKPLILQNASVVAGTANQSRMYQSGLNGTLNKTAAAIGGDHDDLKLKLDKLLAKFTEENKDKNAFKDTFFDQDILGEIVASKNYFKLSLDLMKYVLHTGNVAKPKVVKKKEGSSLYSLYKK